MSNYQTCTRCGERYFAGSAKDAGRCGVCVPRLPEVDWSLVPASARMRGTPWNVNEQENDQSMLQQPIPGKFGPRRDGTEASDMRAVHDPAPYYQKYDHLPPERVKPTNLAFVVSLDESDLTLADEVARRRVTNNRATGLKQVYGANTDDPLEYDRLGCRGELAFALWAGVEWSADDTYLPGRPDFLLRGRMIEVRTSQPGARYLILHPEATGKQKAGDHPERIYVLLTSNRAQTKFLVKGWILGSKGMIDTYWGDPKGTGRPAYWIPEADLQSADILIGGTE